MNREIKFRAWDKINNCFFDWKEQYNTLEFNEGIPDRIILYDTEGVLEKDEFELMQYTGIKDKNGKAIYEGDIVLGRFILDDVEDYIYLSLTDMERKNQSKTFLIKDISYLYTNPIPEDIEVIGNIYENKDVLKELSI